MLLVKPTDLHARSMAVWEPWTMALKADWAEHMSDHFQWGWRIRQAQLIQANGICVHPTKKRWQAHRNSRFKWDAEANPVVWQLSQFPYIINSYISVSVFFRCGCQCRALTLSLKYGELTIPFQSCLCKTNIFPLTNSSSPKINRFGICAI